MKKMFIEALLNSIEMFFKNAPKYFHRATAIVIKTFVIMTTVIEALFKVTQFITMVNDNTCNGL